MKYQRCEVCASQYHYLTSLFFTKPPTVITGICTKLYNYLKNNAAVLCALIWSIKIQKCPINISPEETKVFVLHRSSLHANRPCFSKWSLANYLAQTRQRNFTAVQRTNLFSPHLTMRWKSCDLFERARPGWCHFVVWKLCNERGCFLFMCVQPRICNGAHSWRRKYANLQKLVRKQHGPWAFGKIYI